MTGKNRDIKPKPLPPPYEPVKPDKKIVRALVNLSAGEASEHQQKIALEWIINEASRAHVPAFFPGTDGQRNTDFALGRAFVGQQIIGLLKVNLIALTGEEDA